MTRVRWALLGGAAALALGGCGNSADYLDPYKKPYAWHPTGAPTANLAAQLVNPRDLAVGRGATEGDAKESTLAIEHVWQDHPKPLSTGQSAATGAASGPGASGGATGGAN